MRSHYWTCSKFADWIRGTPKPGAETSEGWSAWTKLAKSAHPFRYWLADDGLDFLQTVIFWPTDKLYSVKYYINNRWVTRTHALSAHPRDIKPGSWCDVGHRFLPCLFNELVDHVEIELAWANIAWTDQIENAKYKPPFWSKGWFRWRTWRCQAAGLDYLAWASSLTFNEDWVEDDHPKRNKPTPQALSAIEVKALYDWWTITRPARIDPYEASGWTELCERRRLTSDKDDIFAGFTDRSPAEKKESIKTLNKLRKIEAQYEKEDEEMMIRLIKVRQSLWT